MRRVFASLLVMVLGSMSASASAAPGLGISISFDRSNQTSAELAGDVWVGVEQGNRAIRTLFVRSISDDTDQVISFGIFDRLETDGQISTDYSRPSRISEWVTFSPENPVVGPGEQVQVTITIEIPESAPDQAFDAVLNVSAGATETAEVESNAGTQAIVGTRIAVEADFWLGVGDALDLTPNFEIVSVDGALIDNQKFVRIFFENNGIVPIKLDGRLQLSDPTLIDRVFDPVDFVSSEFSQGQLTFVDVPVPSEVEDGLWRAFVTAEADGVRKTKLFEGNLVFDDPNISSLGDLILRILAFVVGAIGLVIGVRIIRRKGPRPPRKPREKPAVRFELPQIPSRSEPPRKFETRRTEEPAKDIELDEWAENLRASLRQIRIDNQALVEKYSIPTEAEPTQPVVDIQKKAAEKTVKAKTAPKKSPRTKQVAKGQGAKRASTKSAKPKPKTTQKSNSKRKTAPVSPGSKRQTRATDSKK